MSQSIDKCIKNVYNDRLKVLLNKLSFFFRVLLSLQLKASRILMKSVLMEVLKKKL